MRDKSIAEAILEYRVKHNLSQTEMANACRLTMQTICNIENGVQSPSKLTRGKILSVIESEKEVEK